ncbi:hypothetical protein M758_1G245600 [Ceratodon purpureus]|nr:hypothetical protein M758_1G245600 [Ceratodon purpureus]
MGNKITRRCSTVDERYTRPQGLYPQRDVDQKKLRRLILDSKLAPCFPGEDETSADFEECPICFLYYPSLNRSKCCSKGVCTECFLQMKSPRAARSTQCPFCKSHNYAVEYRGSKTLEEKGIEAAEEQKFIEAKIRMRKQELLDDEERELRKEEGRTTPTTPVDAHDTSLLVELPEVRSSPAQQESVTSGMSDRPSSCDDLDSSWVCEEYGSEGSLAPTPAPRQSIAPLPPSSQPRSDMDSATSQHQPGPAPPGYTRHRDDEFDFDLEDIMVMEAIWQSIQDQGTRHRYTVSEPPRMAPNQLADLNNESQEDAGGRAVSEASPPVVASGATEHLHQSGRMAGGLASAIAALAERHAIKGEAMPASKQTTNVASPSEPEPEPVDEDVGESAGEADALKSVSDNRFSARCDESGLVSGGSDLHAMTVTLATDSGSGSLSASSSSEADQSDVSMESCCDGQSSQQAEDGASTSTCGAYSNDASCVAPMNSPVVTMNRCATDADGKVMLPKSFEEQMMLAMALSLADAQSRARLEDSHPRPLDQRIFE